MRDLAAGRTFLASRADGPSGEPANAESRYPALDADGSRVVFQSNATNLGDGDADSFLDIHVRDLDSGRTILASRGAGGAKGDGESGVADMSADGNRVAFSSYATNLGDGDTDVQPDIHLRDLAAETTTLVRCHTRRRRRRTGRPPAVAGFLRRARRVRVEARATCRAGTASTPRSMSATWRPNTLVLASRARTARRAHPAQADPSAR